MLVLFGVVELEFELIEEKRDAPFMLFDGKRDAPSLFENREAPSLLAKRDAPFWSLSRLNALSLPPPKPFVRLPLLPNGRRSLLPRLKLFPPEFPRLP